MRAVTAKVFNSGLPGNSFTEGFLGQIEHCEACEDRWRITVSEANPSARRLKVFLSLRGSRPDFPKIAGNTSRNVRRNWE
jgi:hypothetical protein